MNYLFFDIECCDGYNICEFGYVITDEKFNIIEKNDYLINPEKPFNLKGKRMQDRIKLPYPEEKYKNSLTFPVYYKKIKELLEKKEQIVLGHSLLNDANFLRIACRRYRLSAINFDCIDSQKMYSEYFNSPINISLEKAKEELKIEQECVLHKSDDDAEVAMLIVKKICENAECSLLDLIKKCPKCHGYFRNNNFSYIENTLPFILEYVKINPDEIFKSQKEKVFMQLSAHKNYQHKVSYSVELLKNHFAEMLCLGKYLKDKNYTFTKKISESDFFIKYDMFDEQGNLRKCVRLNSAKLYIENGKKIQICDFETFVNYVGLTLKELKDLPFPTESDFNCINEKDDNKNRKKYKHIEESGNVSISEIIEYKNKKREV